jgi:hypothetical protein
MTATATSTGDLPRRLASVIDHWSKSRTARITARNVAKMMIVERKSIAKLLVLAKLF